MRRASATSVLIVLALLGCDEEEGKGPNPQPTPDSGLADTGSAELDAGSLDGSAPDASAMCSEGPRKPPPPLHLAIVNGTRLPTLVPLSVAQRNAVVGLGSDTDLGASCSGTLIADRVVLTATHCTAGLQPSSLSVYFGVDDLAPDLVLSVDSKLEHPVEDMALLVLSAAPATMIDVAPIPIYLGTLSSADEGTIVEQAGYGSTESSDSGRFFVTETLFYVDATSFGVDGEGTRGVCFGDSGGPSMIVAPEGDARVLGCLSEGDAECGNQDYFIRADALRAWIETVTGPTPGTGPIPCGTTTAVGFCENEGKTATYCSGGVFERRACAAAEVCGWSSGDSGWRCLAPAQDPCEGLSQIGACNGQVARWCDRGQIYQRDCAACGEACIFLGARLGYDCDIDPLNCGELDYLGRCDGNTSEWCNQEDQRERLDCTTQGQICRFVDNQTGYYCDDP